MDKPLTFYLDKGKTDHESGYLSGYTDKQKEDIDIIRKMRSEFGKDYSSVKGDRDCELIIQAKVVALGQVLEALGDNNE